MDKYKDLIDKAISMCEEAAKLTGNTWDDAIAAAARTIFQNVFTRPIVGGSERSAVANEATCHAAMPSWLMPLVIEIAAQIIKLLRKE